MENYMKIVDLYIRVSTDEQADKGYSQRNQEEVLKRYCAINSFQIRKIYFEDHSAKTFNRPEWNKLLIDYKTRKGNPDLILFTKWDRFSRNAGDAYQMISTLRRFGIEPQAIEQPLDLSIPENKMMLAFYLAAPEVENDRRALNVFFGMRRAKKEGRWMASAPVGYCNKTTEDGRKYIAPREPQASIMKWVFEELERGILAADQVRRLANRKGLKCSKNNFWTKIHNPVYCGKIFIPKYKDEESQLVDGIHEPIISEALFYAVQDVLNGKKRRNHPNTKIVSHDNLPLRGFLSCPKCNRTLSGSASKGRNNYYYYYHCTSSCGCRYKVETANEAFIKELRKFKPDQAVGNLYKMVISNHYKSMSAQQQSGSKQIVDEINRVNTRLSKARELLLDEGIDRADYHVIKKECEEKIRPLEAKLTEVKSHAVTINVDDLLDQAFGNLSRVDLLYSEADVTKKREVIGSIYNEKLTFDGFEYRTAQTNEAARIIYQINNELREKKYGKAVNISMLSHMVIPLGFEPRTPTLKV